MPDEVLDRLVEAASFADFAIDTNNTVIEDPERREYYVTYDGCLYTYSPSRGQRFRDRIERVSAWVTMNRIRSRHNQETTRKPVDRFSKTEEQDRQIRQIRHRMKSEKPQPRRIGLDDMDASESEHSKE